MKTFYSLRTGHFILRNNSNIPKSQIRKFSELIPCRFADLLQVWQFADLRFALQTKYFCNLQFADLRTQLIFADSKLLQIRKYTRIIFILTKNVKCSHSNLRTTFAFRDSYMALRSLKYSYVGKEYIRGKSMRIWSETLLYTCKFADLRFADWVTKEICGFAICGLIMTFLRISDLRTGTPQKVAYVWLRIEPKNLRICDLRTNNKNLRAHLWNLVVMGQHILLTWIHSLPGRSCCSCNHRHCHHHSQGDTLPHSTTAPVEAAYY